MEAVTAIFTSFEAARRATTDLCAIGIPLSSINFLTPSASEKEIHTIRTEDAEQPGMGAAVGGVVGTAVGASAGATLGLAVASTFIPGVGTAVAMGLAAAALLGIGGAAVGASLEEALTKGLPKDELFFYEEALRQGRTVIIVLGDGDEQAGTVRSTLARHGAESIDAARERWWLGLRDSEKEHYDRKGQDFARDENEYRQGFEAALRAEARGRSYAEAADYLRINYPALYHKDSFRRGYERGRDHYQELQTNHPVG